MNINNNLESERDFSSQHDKKNILSQPDLAIVEDIAEHVSHQPVLVEAGSAVDAADGNQTSQKHAATRTPPGWRCTHGLTARWNMLKDLTKSKNILISAISVKQGSNVSENLWISTGRSIPTTPGGPPHMDRKDARLSNLGGHSSKPALPGPTSKPLATWQLKARHSSVVFKMLSGDYFHEKTTYTRTRTKAL